MKKIWGVVLLVILFVGMTGCAPVNYTKLSLGLSMDMPKEQVVQLMGEPRRVSARKVENGISERYFWWSPKVMGLVVVDNEMLSTDRMAVRFLNGKVIEWGDNYDFSQTIDRSIEMQEKIIKNAQKKATEPAAPPAKQ